MTLVDLHHQVFKANIGLTELDGSPREVAFCSHAISQSDDLFEIGDSTLDPRFMQNPLVTGAPNIRFYAGAALELSGGHKIGTLCVIDRRARDLDEAQRKALRALARAATLSLTGLALRKAADGQAEELTAMKEESRWRYESTPAMLHSIGPDGGIIAVSDRWLQELGYDRDEVIGRASTDFLTEESKEIARQEGLPRLFNGGGSDGLEYQFVRKNGELIDVSLSATLERDRDGRPTRSLAVLKDITLQKQAIRDLAAARDAAERANRAKSRFLAGMSHELRTPLNGILGYARLLRLDGELNAAQASRVDAMLSAGNHLLDIITAVLDMSAIEADQIVLRPVGTDLQDLVSQCLDVVGSGAEAKSLTLSLSASRGLPSTITVDPIRLRQVLLNLLGNAVKFTEQGGVDVRLRPALKAEAIRIEVADTGPGVPPDKRAKLFQEFSRIETDGSVGVEGAGLGLAISARLIKLMKGQVGYENNRGGGSVFWLELPVVSTSAISLPPERASASVPSQQSLRVLIVDDVEMNREIASSFLESAGHTVLCVNDGEAAVSAAASQDLDVILMDVRMPGIGGLEATRRIRSLPPQRGFVPIIGLTAQAFAEQIAECRAAGMNSHLGKPYHPDALLAAVAAAAAVRPAVPPSAEQPQATAPTELFDSEKCEQLAKTLSPERMSKLVVSLAERLVKLRQSLDEVVRTGIGSVNSVERAHSLIGPAGMLGMTRFTAAAQAFESAAASNIGDMSREAGRLREVVDASVSEIVAAKSVGIAAELQAALLGADPSAACMI